METNLTAHFALKLVDNVWYMLAPYNTLEDYDSNINKGDLFYKDETKDIVIAEYSPASKVSRKVLASTKLYPGIYSFYPEQIIYTTYVLTEEDLIRAAKYGYEYHQTASFPSHKFEDECVNNFKQALTALYPIPQVCEVEMEFLTKKDEKLIALDSRFKSLQSLNLKNAKLKVTNNFINIVKVV